MEVGDESCELLSPLSRTRCNTWHAGLDDDTPIPADNTLLLTAKAVKRPARRNAWGTASYADLIATAIESSPDKRLTLSQIYDWMVTNVQYFNDKEDNSSSSGWKNSIRHNLSLHRRFVRVPHNDGRSSWWTVNQSEHSSIRWPRGSNSTRHRANSIDTRTYLLQQHRRNRKSYPESTSESLGKSITRTVPMPSFSVKMEESNSCSSLKLFDDQNFSTSSSGNAAFSGNSIPFSLCSVDEYLTKPFCANSYSDVSTNTTDFPCTSGLTVNTNDEFLSFHAKPSPAAELGFATAPFAADECFSNVMITQLSPLGWNQSETGAARGSGVTISESCLPPSQFSDDSMLTASQLTDSSLDEPVFCDDRELLLAAYSSVSSPSDLPSFRRGSDAPPPSPESNSGEPSPSFDEAVSNLAEMKVESTDATGSSIQFATGWTTLYPLKTDDLSSLSDMDMEH